MEEEEEGGMESRIQEAMRSRVPDFRNRADSLTFEAVRRELEKDLELDKYALDVHKRYVKQLLEKFLNEADDESISKDTGESTAEGVNEEQAEPSGENLVKEDSRELNSQEEEMEDSPVMGLLTGNKSTKSGNVETQGNEKTEIPSESTIKKAIWKRAAYLRTNSEKITVAGVRRLLEEDLQLDKYTLDPLKKLISKQLDEVVNAPSPKSATPVKKKSSLNSQSKTSNKTSSIDSSDSSDSEKDDDEEDEEAPKKKGGTKGKIQKAEGIKKRKRPVKEDQVSRKKQSKAAASEENSDGEDSGETSEDGQSRSSAAKTVKKKEVLPPAYGKQVEHLKSIIKSCGMSVPPTVYKKAKQIPDSKRESFLIKELEQILSKEGLSSDPSEKEIKDVKRRKERAKELEGIDTSNIVLSSRRRSTASFVPPPKPKPPVKNDGDDAEDSDNEDGADDDDDDDNDSDDSDSQSEEVLEDDEDSD